MVFVFIAGTLSDLFSRSLFSQEFPVFYAEDSLELRSPAPCFPFLSLELLVCYEQGNNVLLFPNKLRPVRNWFVSVDHKDWDLTQAFGITEELVWSVLKRSPLRKTHSRRVSRSLFSQFWIKASSGHLFVPHFELILKPGIDCPRPLWTTKFPTGCMAALLWLILSASSATILTVV